MGDSPSGDKHYEFRFQAGGIVVWNQKMASNVTYEGTWSQNESAIMAGTSRLLWFNMMRRGPNLINSALRLRTATDRRTTSALGILIADREFLLRVAERVFFKEPIRITILKALMRRG